MLFLFVNAVEVLLKMNSVALKDVCPICSKEVRQCQQALLCDRCEFWHHRTCDRSIDQNTYRQLIKENQTFEWSCKSCSEVSIDFYALLIFNMRAINYLFYCFGWMCVVSSVSNKLFVLVFWLNVCCFKCYIVL